jgi:glucose/arabinose dehydrogenase
VKITVLASQMRAIDLALLASAALAASAPTFPFVSTPAASDANEDSFYHDWTFGARASPMMLTVGGSLLFIFAPLGTALLAGARLLELWEHEKRGEEVQEDPGSSRRQAHRARILRQIRLLRFVLSLGSLILLAAAAAVPLYYFFVDFPVSMLGFGSRNTAALRGVRTGLHVAGVRVGPGLVLACLSGFFPLAVALSTFVSKGSRGGSSSSEATTWPRVSAVLVLALSAWSAQALLGPKIAPRFGDAGAPALPSVASEEPFEISLWARVPHARSMALGNLTLSGTPTPTVVVGTRKGDIYAVVASPSTSQEPWFAKPPAHVWKIASRSNSAHPDLPFVEPNGVVWLGDTLYVADVSGMVRFNGFAQELSAAVSHHVAAQERGPVEPDIDETTDANSAGASKVRSLVLRPPDLVARFPSEQIHGWKYTKVSPFDGKLYISLGAPCNVCIRDDKRFATIMRSTLPLSELEKAPLIDFEIVATGVRNSVGFDWHPNGDLFFTENGRDMLSNDVPPDELNMIPASGLLPGASPLHFGFPYCFGYNRTDRDVKLQPEQDDVAINCSDSRQHTGAAIELVAHAAALGVVADGPGALCGPDSDCAIFAEHGSWNADPPAGYKIAIARRPVVVGKTESADRKSSWTYKPLVGGFVGSSMPYGRPVDVARADAGALLVSDDHLGAIFLLRAQ